MGQLSSSSSSIRCFGPSISSNSPFFTAQIKISQAAVPKNKESIIRIIVDLVMVYTFRNLSELNMTQVELKAMAIAANIGERYPKAAKGNISKL